MFRIRRIYDDILPVDKAALRQVQALLLQCLPGVDPAEAERLPRRLSEPVQRRYRSILFVAEDGRARVLGFGLLLHMDDVNCCVLDYLCASIKGREKTKGLDGAVGPPHRGGVGGALYERIRAEAAHLGSKGLFFECLPAPAHASATKPGLLESKARLRFYERLGARIVDRTAYETPFKPQDGPGPHLMADLLGRETVLRRETAQAVVQAFLKRKYGRRCPKGYIETVLHSFQDDPVRLRAPSSRSSAAPPLAADAVRTASAALIVNDSHSIHHVQERGYVEAPVRISAILRALEPVSLFRRVAAKPCNRADILAVHEKPFMEYLEKVCQSLELGRSVYPYVFPLRNRTRPPKELALRAGYYCLDTFTPLNRAAYAAARAGVDCAATGARAILSGFRLAYVLTRPPGHHAERMFFGGFCYYNNAAVAANILSAYGRTAVLDIDYHHGNGAQDIFYRRNDVLTVSIHGHPRFSYPYFTGFEDERGEGDGEGMNRNYPLPESVDGGRHRDALERALHRVKRFRPDFLVVALGLDTAKGDPTGTWTLNSQDFKANGRILAAMRLPLLVVQEGGYAVRVLGNNARAFFEGVAEGADGL